MLRRTYGVRGHYLRYQILSEDSCTEGCNIIFCRLLNCSKGCSRTLTHSYHDIQTIIVISVYWWVASFLREGSLSGWAETYERFCT